MWTGTVDNISSTIIKKKEQLNLVLLVDLLIKEDTQNISLKIHAAAINIVIDKLHKQLFEDLT